MMKKIKLKQLESNQLSTNEKKSTLGGKFELPPLEIEEWCYCRDGSWVLAYDGGCPIGCIHAIKPIF